MLPLKALVISSERSEKPYPKSNSIISSGHIGRLFFPAVGIHANCLANDGHYHSFDVFFGLFYNFICGELFHLPQN